MKENIRFNAKVILINNRYFVRFGKNKSVLTAYYLAGATLYCVDYKLNEVLNVLDKKGRVYDVLNVGLTSGC
ncbi:MAG: hypothetical protein PHE60_10020 [Sulfurospirillaceae bacterium]|nr:hypothetical protein [Sulfurospirillaceae bacterium]